MGLIIKDGVKYGGSPDFTDYRAEQVTLDAKNLLPITASSMVVGNLTLTVNSDNSITASGSGEFYYTLCTIGRDDFNKYYAGKTMTVSGTPASILSTNFRIFGSISGGSNIIDESINPTALLPTVNNNVIFYIRIVGSVNTTFQPMLRLSTDPVATYAPYAKTNKQLTDDVKTLADKFVSTTFNDTTNTNGGLYIDKPSSSAILVGIKSTGIFMYSSMPSNVSDTAYLICVNNSGTSISSRPNLNVSGTAYWIVF